MAKTITDEQVNAAREVFEAGKSVAENEIIRLKEQLETLGPDREDMGVLRKINLDRAYNDLMEAVVLHRVKERKSYKQVGATWAGFCEAVGKNVRTVDLMLQDVRPLFEAFSEHLTEMAKMPFNKIRYLGKTISESGSDFEGKTMEELVVKVETLEAAHKAQAEELEAQKKAHERVQHDTHKTMTKLEKELTRLQKGAAARGLTPPEETFLKTMEQARISIDATMLRLDPDRMVDLFPGDPESPDRPEPTPRMVAAYLSTLAYARTQILAAYDTAQDLYSDPTMSPEAAWQPGMGGTIPSLTDSKKEA